MTNQFQAWIMFGLSGELWRVVPVNIPLLLQEDKVTFGVVCLHYLRLQSLGCVSVASFGLQQRPEHTKQSFRQLYASICGGLRDEVFTDSCI